jgi:hypothetical protein
MRILLATALIALGTPAVSSQRLQPAPHVHAGQTLFYQIDFSSSRSSRTESRVVSAQSTPAENVNTSALLQVEITEVSATGFRMKTYYSERDPASRTPRAPVPASPSSAPDKMIEVTVSFDGSSKQLKGIDQLSAAQQFVWNNWLARFTSQMAFPKGGVYLSQKWQSGEREVNPSPIAALVWTRKYQYVRDEPCGATTTSETCAVILVRAVLRQKSSEQNATPQDYKLRNLKTRGTAAGQNETILYISLPTGLLVRSSEDAKQSMDAIVALANGSNEVHYQVDAKSHAEIRLLPDSTSGTR